jgi:hypothetical protein
MAETVWLFFRGEHVRICTESGGHLRPVRFDSSWELPLLFTVIDRRVEIVRGAPDVAVYDSTGIERRFLERAGDPTQLALVGGRYEPLAQLFQAVILAMRSALRGSDCSGSVPDMRAILVWSLGIHARARDAVVGCLSGAGVPVIAQMEEYTAIAMGLYDSGEADGPFLLLDAAYGSLSAAILLPSEGGCELLVPPRALVGYGMGALGAVADALVSQAALAHSIRLSPERRAYELWGAMPLADIVLETWHAGPPEWSGTVRLTGHPPTAVRVRRGDVAGSTATMRHERNAFVEEVLATQPVQGAYIWSKVLWDESFVLWLEDTVGAGCVHRPLDDGWPVVMSGALRAFRR